MSSFTVNAKKGGREEEEESRRLTDPNTDVPTPDKKEAWAF
jgi:hypothetical protein